MYLGQPPKSERRAETYSNDLLSMKQKIIAFFLLVAAAFPPACWSQEPAQQLDAMIRKGMEDWHIPGLATVVVQDGKVVFSEVYGVKNVSEGSPVDRETLFNMGSTTKAVVCMALGILVDQGKLSWEDRVRDHLPEFRLSDAYITEEARVRDLLTHNLGIAGADLLWVLDSTSTKETLTRFAHAKKAYPLRGGYQYNNLMYAVAGEVIRAASGTHWTSFVEEHIFNPLEMKRTVARASDIFTAGNYVTPYFYEEGEGFVEVPPNLSDQIGAAGMIWTCAEDMEHYLQMLVGGGMYQGRAILKPETFDYLFEPHTLLTKADFYPTTSLTNPNWLSYGLGWFQQDYRGHKLDFHTGSIGGLVAIAGVMHDRNTAVYVLANRDHAELRHAILYQALDLWAFEGADRDWHAEIWSLYESIRMEGEKRQQLVLYNRVTDGKMTLQLNEYTGKYKNKMLGTAEVIQKDQGLLIRFNDYVGFDCQHWHYDTFRSNNTNKYLMETSFIFNLGEDGKIEEMEAFGMRFRRETAP